MRFKFYTTLLLIFCLSLSFGLHAQSGTDRVQKDPNTAGFQHDPGMIKLNQAKQPNVKDWNPLYKGGGDPIQVKAAGMPTDGRNLPLTQDGKLKSVDGFPVEFKVPDNPNDPGICATPTPYIMGLNGMSRAGCPEVVPCDNFGNRDANIPGPADPIKYIKLNWTVILNGGASTNIDQPRIDALMAEVNADFLPYRIQFCADPATFVEDATHYSLNVSTEDASLKTTHGTTPNDWCNVYVVGNITSPSAGGYARFPYDPFGGYNIRGGVVLARGNMFVGTHTLAHELGHTFGLYHTFHGVDEVTPCTACYENSDYTGMDTEGDWCSDTRPHPTNANVCGDAGTDGCAPFAAWTGSPVDNHMSYSFCTSTFTSQQGGRMHCMIDTYLNNWVLYGGATCASLPPVADFNGTPTFGNYSGYYNLHRCFSSSLNHY